MIKWIKSDVGTTFYNFVLENKLQEKYKVIDVRDLVDKFGNNIEYIKNKINNGIAALEKGEKIIVACDYGMSRSNSIAVGIIAKHYNLSFKDAVDLVIERTNEKSIKVEVLSMVQEAIETKKISKSGNNILVTGGSGFLGQALLKKLNSFGEYNLFAPSSSAINLGHGTTELYQYVLNNSIDKIIHLANPRIYTINSALADSLLYLKNILDVCRMSNIELIFLSSWEVYSGYKTAHLLANHTLPLCPKGTYAESKVLCENLIEHYRKAYDLNIPIVRFGPIFGLDSDKPKFIYNFIHKALRNEEIITHRYLNGLPALNLLHIDDAVNVLVGIIEKKAFNYTVNIGGAELLTTTEIAEWIVKITNSNSVVRQLEIEDYISNIQMDNRKFETDFNLRIENHFFAELEKIIKNIER